MVICWFVHTAEDWSLHVARLRLVHSLSLSSRYFVRMWRSIRWRSRGLHCSVEWAAPQHCCIADFLLFAFCVGVFYLSMSVFFFFNPSADITISRVPILSVFLLFLSFTVLAHGFSHILRNNFLSKTEPRSQLCCIKLSLGSQS